MSNGKILVISIMGLLIFGGIGSVGVNVEKNVINENTMGREDTGSVLFSSINVRVREKTLKDTGGYSLFYITFALGDHDVSWNVDYDVWHGGEFDYGIHEGVAKKLSLGPFLISFGRESYSWDNFDVGSFLASLIIDGTVANTDSGRGDDDDGEFEVDAKGDYEGIIGEVIQFEGYAKGGIEPYTWFWDFGDGDTSTEQFPQHMYLADGEYAVTLTVTDANASTVSDETRTIIENDFEADAGGDYDGKIGESIQFEGKGEKGMEPYTWFWDFGDGNTSTEQNPQHEYISVGTYTATLTVTDAVSNIASDTTFVEIEEE